MNDKALDILSAHGMLPGDAPPAEIADAEEMAWEEIDRLFSGRPEPVKFDQIGDQVVGTVVRGYTRQRTKYGTNEPEFWDDGTPKLEPVIEIQTRDGIRSLYVSSWRMRNAIGEAFREAGVRGPRRGGQIIVRYTSNEAPQGGGNPAKVYDAGYDPGRMPLDVRMPKPPELAGTTPGQGDEPPF